MTNILKPRGRPRSVIRLGEVDKPHGFGGARGCFGGADTRLFRFRMNTRATGTTAIIVIRAIVGRPPSGPVKLKRFVSTVTVVVCVCVFPAASVARTVIVCVPAGAALLIETTPVAELTEMVPV